jgi:hypothetical protein
MAQYPWEQPLGATPAGDGRVTFRAWAPRAEQVAVRVRGTDHPLRSESFDVHSVTVEATHSDDYWFVLDGQPFPDPCSRWQPAGLRGPSRVLDAAAFAWTDADWEPPALRDVVRRNVARIHAAPAAGTRRPALLVLAAIDNLVKGAAGQAVQNANLALGLDETAGLPQ